MQQGEMAVESVITSRDDELIEPDFADHEVNLIDLRTRRPRVVPDLAPVAHLDRPFAHLTDTEVAANFHQRVADGLAAAEVVILPNRQRAYVIAKRMLDLVIAVPAVVLFAPVMLIIAALIRIDSQGPAIFNGLRVGKDGHLIKFHKFRTMYVDSKARFPELYEYHPGRNGLEDVFYKSQDNALDPRVTRLGRFLRKSTLDELPNLLDVVRGSLSIVGPRPEAIGMCRYYANEQLVKYTVKPGVACLAACSGRNELSIAQQIELDVEYVAKQSFWLDIRIIFKTAVVILKGQGAA